jgi:hypothetical protein
MSTDQLQVEVAGRWIDWAEFWAAVDAPEVLTAQQAESVEMAAAILLPVVGEVA